MAIEASRSRDVTETEAGQRSVPDFSTLAEACVLSGGSAEMHTERESLPLMGRAPSLRLDLNHLHLLNIVQSTFRTTPPGIPRACETAPSDSGVIVNVNANTATSRSKANSERLNNRSSNRTQGWLAWSCTDTPTTGDTGSQRSWP
ncbi:unnamed protein product [Parascedosporium putredinis]|uniref:Uncharacterized protein n=1 Tax=Parascedosporium putredinis TaxID=1442378 RepID=A0A9P1H612_9PEZI|nr:unnamed protein product [Parascedosporium putredinis]CAI7998313.1 unnamed protein product [Parascedosporium putredinis]